jgi:hypothetical protein
MFTNYECKHCGSARHIPTSRVVKATFLRCDDCYAISSLSMSERLALIDAAVSDPPPAVRKGLAVQSSGYDRPDWRF